MNIMKILLPSLMLLISQLAFADCTSPVAKAGTMRWNTAASDLQYCDGTNWKNTRYGGYSFKSQLQDLNSSVITSPTAPAVSGTNVFTVTGSKLVVLDSSNVNSISQIGSLTNAALAGSTRAVAYRNYLYVRNSDKILIINISTPSAPVLTGTYTDSTNLSYSLYDNPGLVIQGNYAYTIDDVKDKLTIVDISNPAAPVLAGSLSIAGATAMDVEGNYAYVAITGGLKVIDVSSVAAPTVVGTLLHSTLLASYYKAVRSFGNRVAILTGTAGAVGSMVTVDVTTKTNPLFVSNWDDSSLERPKDLDKYGNYAIGVQANGRNSTNYISVFDMNAADPSVPIYQMPIPGPTGAPCSIVTANSQRAVCLESNYDTMHVMDMALKPALTQPPLGYLSSSDAYFTKLVTSGTYSVLLGGSGEQLVTMDTSNPANPVFKGQFKYGNYTNVGAPDVVFDGTYAYMSLQNWSSVAIVDVTTNPSLPKLISTTYGLSSADDLALKGNYLFVSVITGVKVLDVSNKVSATVVASISLTKPDVLYISGNYLYTGTDANDTLSIYDISTPTSPTLVGSLTDATNLNFFEDMIAVGNYLYVHAGSSQLTVINITNKASPTYTANMVNASFSGQLASSGNYLYTNGRVVNITNAVSPTLGITFSGGLPVVIGTSMLTNAVGTNGITRSYNVSNPASPTLNVSLTYTPLFSGSTYMAVSGTMAYVAGSSSNVFSVVNFSVPSSPTVMGFRSDATNIPSPAGVFQQTGYAYVVGANYITIMNVSNPTSPTVSGRLSDATNLANATAVYVSGNYAYVTKTSGLTVVDVTNKAAPTFVTQLSNTIFSTCRRMLRDGNYLYVSCASSNSLVVVNISTPTAPSLTGYYQSNTDMAAPKSMHKIGNYVYVGTTSGVTTLNVSTPATPTLEANSSFGSVSQLVGNGNNFYFTYYGSNNALGMGALQSDQSVKLGNTSAYKLPGGAVNLQINGNYLYQTAAGSIAVYDISPKQVPDRINNPYNEASRLDGVKGVAVSGTVAYVLSANTSRLTTVNVANPASPSIMSSLYEGSLLDSTSISLASGKAFITTTNSGYKGGVVNATNPAAMSFLTSVYQNAGANHADTAGDYFFWIKDSFSTDYLSATRISTLPGVTTYDSTAIVTPVDFAISGNYAYVCTSSSDIKIVNISNPVSMPIAATFTNADFNGCTSVLTSGNYLYVAASTNQKVTIVDISTPLSPTIIGSVTDGRFTNVKSMKVVGNHLHLVVSSPKLLATIDISNPAAPVVVDSTTSNLTTPNTLFFSGTRGYLTDSGNDSLFIFEYTTPTTLGACTKSGEIIFDKTQNTLKYCKGTTYFAMGPSPGAGGVGCISPIAAPGQYQWFSGLSKFRYCDGSNWVDVGN